MTDDHSEKNSEETGNSDTPGDLEPLDFAGLLDILGHTDDDHTALTAIVNGKKGTGIAPRAKVIEVAAQHADSDLWFNINPTSCREKRRRGTSAEVSRLATLAADADDEKMSRAGIDEIIFEVAGLIGWHSAWVESGHGRHFYWPVDRSDAEALSTAEAAVLTARFDLLLKMLAAGKRGTLDKVSDLARMLRVPGSTNREKRPVPVVGYRERRGVPLRVAEIIAALDAFGVPQINPTDALRDVVAPPSDWSFNTARVDVPCAWLKTKIEHLANDEINGSRHNWLLSQSVKIHCAHRRGCIGSQKSLDDARAALWDAFTTRIAGEPGRPDSGDRAAWNAAERIAATKTDAEVLTETGGEHHHDPAADAEDDGPDFSRCQQKRNTMNDNEPQDQPPEAGQSGAEASEPAMLSKLLRRSDLHKLPDPEPLVDNVLDRGTTALIYGPYGSCKTFLALDLAASVATGRPWQARETLQQRVLYIAAEGAAGLKVRVDAWEIGWQRDIPDGALDVYPHPVNLTSAAELAELTALLNWSDGYGLVVIDTLSRCMVGADENSAKDCGAVVDALTVLRDHTPDKRGVIMGLHHPGKDGRTFRGSSVFEAGADTVHRVARDGLMIDFVREKRRDGPLQDAHRFKLDKIDVDPDAGLTSVVLSAYQEGGHMGGHGERAEKLVGIFAQQFAHIGATKAELRTAAMEAGIANMTFYRALNDLLESGALINTGTDKRPHYMKAS
jgi:AAA domain